MLSITKVRQKSMERKKNMQTIELGNANTIPLLLLEESHRVHSELTGHDVIVYPENKGGECKLVTTCPQFADYFGAVMLAEQAE